MDYKFLSFLFIGLLSVSFPAFSGEEDDGGLLLKNLRRYQGVEEDHKDIRVNVRLGHFDRSLIDPTTDIRTENDETNLLRVNVKLVDRVELQYGQGTERFSIWKVGEKNPRERLTNSLYQASVGTRQNIGALKLRERLTLMERNGLKEHYREDETFVAGAVSARYEVQWQREAANYQLDLETGYERDREFRPELGRGLRELDTYQGRVTLHAPWWLIESLYENQYADDGDDFYRTQNTAAAYYSLNSSGSGDYLMFGGGVQHRRTNLNFRDVLGLVLLISLRDGAWLRDSDTGEEKAGISPVGMDLIFFMDPTGGSEGGNNADTWEVTMRMTGYGYGADVFVRDMAGKKGQSYTAGGQWYLWADF